MEDFYTTSVNLPLRSAVRVKEKKTKQMEEELVIYVYNLNWWRLIFKEGSADPWWKLLPKVLPANSLADCVILAFPHLITVFFHQFQPAGPPCL